jgi:glycosyltransferase involved in cell wall biosynthesis
VVYSSLSVITTRRKWVSAGNMSILLVSYHFHPSNEIGARRVTALARYLTDKGERVVVVCACACACDDKAVSHSSEDTPGIIAIHVPEPSRPLLGALVALKRLLPGRNRAARQDAPTGEAAAEFRTGVRAGAAHLRKLLFRILYFPDGARAWTRRASRAALLAGRTHDAKLLIASGPPHGVLLAAAQVAGRLGIPFVADLRDSWADAHAHLHPDSRIELELLRALERRVMRRAAAVTTTSAVVASSLRHRYDRLRERVSVIPNGYDGDIAPALRCTQGRLSILFAGELYEGRNPFPLLSGIEWLLARAEVEPARIEVTFMGRVQTYCGQSLQAWLHGKRCAEVVRLVPPQNAAAVAAAVAQSTLLLNLAQQQPLAVPAKTYEQLASGREILLICEDDCETARVVAGIPGVSQVDAENFQALTARLLDLYARHVVEGCATVPDAERVRPFSRAASNERFHALASALISCGSSPATVGVKPGTP